MNIQSNIIKENLKNVLFVCGNACGGKTPMSEAPAEKYNLYLNDMYKMYDKRISLADKKYQPNIELTNELEKEQMKASGLFVYERQQMIRLTVYYQCWKSILNYKKNQGVTKIP